MKTRVSSGALSSFHYWLVVASAACLATCPVGAQPGEILAQQIVAESGFQGGLIVAVGGAGRGSGPVSGQGAQCAGTLACAR